MTTASTSLLGLALPVQGELSGTWGDTVNNSITSLVDSAVAGTTTLASDVDVTLSTTALTTNQARQAIILWTANGTATRYITAPALSKTYVVINKTSSTQSIVIRGVGPTTGVTVPSGNAYLVAWDGVDFVKIDADAVTLTGTQTLTNKEIVKRVVAVADGTSITPNADTSDIVTQANTQSAGTLTMNAPSGSAVNGQGLVIRMSSTAVQTFAWNAIYQGSADLPLPLTTSGASKTDYLGFIYNSTTTKWQVLAKNFGF
jgi:hypothetical protein